MKMFILFFLISFSFLYCSDYNNNLIEFDNNIIKIKITQKEFEQKSYNEKVEILSQTSNQIINYVSNYFNSNDIVFIISSLKEDKNNQIIITKQPDKRIEKILNSNILFATDLKQSIFHNKLIKNIVDNLNKQFGYKYEFDKIAENTEGFTDTQVYNVHLNEYRKKYIIRALMYHDIAKSIIGQNLKSDEEKIMELFDWVYINISKNSEILYNYDFNDLPLYLMIRGAGACDRSAWVLCTLAYHLGFDAHLIYLYKNLEDTESFHTVAEIKVNNKWYVFDPYNYKIYKESIYQLSKKDKNFKYSMIFFNSLESRSLLPIMKLVEIIAETILDNQKFSFDIFNSIYSYILHIDEFKINKKNYKEFCESLTNDIINKINELNAIRLEPLTIRFARWDYPFRLKGYYFDNFWNTVKKEAFPFIEIIENVRMKQLLGKYEEADKIFEELLKTNTNNKFFESEVEYFHILNTYYQKSYKEIPELIEEYLNKYPESKRKEILLILLARTYEQLEEEVKNECKKIGLPITKIKKINSQSN
ncbi:MAG TPA: transglutaminase domain-containing protein [bacterium]|nr:transglutaminase domain-containing protein [bacterium]